MKTIIYTAAAVLFPLAAAAHDGMAVENAYARSANPQTAAAFMLLDNHRAVSCTLVGVASDAAAKVELHTNLDVDGVMKMQPIEGGIEVAPGAQHELARGGDHVMMMGLKAPLENGQTIALSLDFGDCGVMEVEVPVDNDRQPEPADAAAGQGETDHSGH
ncbi:copper chaperone PCu(A)C [Paracoccus sp. M683]|uniref:copper chaperone PCu(A)C n=1 Tax=Paracoccus sp. M683 TaxID=2594268 RepID=UPI00117D2701|nr:copper chaperone PCu(A)C [Paracoccus sp. M683]TRW95476.1 copper chaperone PCu(A)C [Paracoccus sp. M683]